MKLGLDRSSTKVRSHGEVGDGSRGENDDSQLVEKPDTSRSLHRIIRNLYVISPWAHAYHKVKDDYGKHCVMELEYLNRNPENSGIGIWVRVQRPESSAKLECIETWQGKYALLSITD
jgi:hypothetical protein